MGTQHNTPDDRRRHSASVIAPASEFATVKNSGRSSRPPVDLETEVGKNGWCTNLGSAGIPFIARETRCSLSPRALRHESSPTAILASGSSCRSAESWEASGRYGLSTRPGSQCIISPLFTDESSSGWRYGQQCNVASFDQSPYFSIIPKPARLEGPSSGQDLQCPRRILTLIQSPHAHIKPTNVRWLIVAMLVVLVFLALQPNRHQRCRCGTIHPEGHISKQRWARSMHSC